MRYKLIALDLDGTLNNDRKTIDPPTRDALFTVQSRGIRVVLASARPMPGLFRERDALDLSAHHGLLMAYNGGAIAEADSGRLLHASPMEIESAREVLRLLEKLPVTPILDDGVVFYVTNRNGYMVEYECRNNRMECLERSDLAGTLDFAPFKILMSAYPEHLQEIQAEIRRSLPVGLSVVQTAPFYLEIIPSHTDKGKGLLSVCRAIGIDPSESIAFGDSENDIPMLRAAGLGIAMGNADDAVKESADRVTLSNNENGIAAALMDIILS